MRKINFKINRNGLFFILFVIGTVAGSVFANYLDISQRNELGILNHYFIDKYASITLNHIDLLKYIILARLKLVLFFWFFGLTFFGIPIIILGTIYFGVAFGFMLSIGIIIYGGSNGLVLNLAYLFPHFIIYVPMFVFLMHKSFEVCGSLYFKKLAPTKAYRLNNKQLFSEYVLVFIICILMTIIGALIETFINPGVVNYTIQHMLNL